MADKPDAGVDSGSGAGADLELKNKDSDAPPKSEDNTDWHALYEEERGKAENYRKALTQKRQLRNKPSAPELENELNDDDKPLTRRDLQESVIPLIVTNREDTLLLSKITDPAKRAYVKQLLENRIVRTGTSEQDIISDIETALAIADSKEKDKAISELKRAVDNKPDAPPSGGGQADRDAPSKVYGWTPEQARALEVRAAQLNLDPEKYKKDIWQNRNNIPVAR